MKNVTDYSEVGTGLLYTV